MNKEILIYASFVNQKYFFNPEYDDLPKDIKRELIVISVSLSNEIRGAFSIGFCDDSNVFFNAIEETELSFDHIGANLQINRLEKEENELFKKLALWYKVFRTSEGQKMKEELLKNDLGEI